MNPVTVTIRIVTYRPSSRYGLNFDRDGEERLKPVEQRELDHLVGSLERVGGLPVGHSCLFGSIGHRATIIGRACSVRSPVEGRAAVDIRFAFLDRGVLQKLLDNDPWPLFEADIRWEQPGEHQVHLEAGARPSELARQAESTSSTVERLLCELDKSDLIIIRAQDGSDNSTLSTLMRSAVKSWVGKEQLTFVTPLLEPVPSFRLQGMTSSSTTPYVFVWPVLDDRKSTLKSRWGYRRLTVSIVLVLAIIFGVFLGSHREREAWLESLAVLVTSEEVLTRDSIVEKVGTLKKWPDKLGPLSVQHGKAENGWSVPDKVEDQLNEYKGHKGSLDRITIELANLGNEMEISSTEDPLDTIKELRVKIEGLNRDIAAKVDGLPLEKQRVLKYEELLQRASYLFENMKLTHDWINDLESWRDQYKALEKPVNEVIPETTVPEIKP
jgi:hypothetical protein